MKKFNKKGFTLTEMIVVIAIIGILAAVMIPGVIGYVNYARKSNDTQQAASMSDEIERYCIENGIDQDNLIGSDIRTILVAKGYNLVPSTKNWTYVYNAESKLVELIKVSNRGQLRNVFRPSDPSNYENNMYLIGEGKSDFEQAVKLLLNFKSQVDFDTAAELVSGSAYESFIAEFNPSKTLYVNNVKNLSSPADKISHIVFTVGTYNLPNLTNANVVVESGNSFTIPACITSINEFTFNKMSHIFNNIDEFENTKTYPEIDLSSLQLSGDATNPTFTLGDLVENTTEQTVSIDIVGYVRGELNDENKNGKIDIGEEENIKLLYEVTVIYYDTNGIVAKGVTQILSTVISHEYAESIKLNYSEIEYEG